MHGVQLVVSYDGSDFAGWQSQPGQRTVQGEIERAIQRMIGAECTVRGASRTDSGVHAHRQVASFAVDRAIPGYGWVRGLNGKLPGDIAVVSARECAPDYNARFDAFGKTYRYLLHLGVERDPLLRKHAWHVGVRRARPRPGGVGPLLDLDAMEEGAKRLVGEHDFRAFRSAADSREGTVRTLKEVRVVRGFGGRDDLLAFEVRGNAFMQHMMRILAGTLLDLGRERIRPDDVPRLLTSSARREDAGETAPPHGLYLVDIELGRIGS